MNILLKRHMGTHRYTVGHNEDSQENKHDIEKENGTNEITKVQITTDGWATQKQLRLVYYTTRVNTQSIFTQENTTTGHRRTTTQDKPAWDE